ncbi:MAG: AraC family transcriptional regulator [Planctomycetota bacterium]|nr:MAG: AraC family transcriptional regulator [Planctomycetota bacterium]
MHDQNGSRERVEELLNAVSAAEGIHPTLIEGVGVARHTSSQPRISVVYEPVIVFVGKGSKRSYLGGQVYTYDPSTYFVLTVPLPAECEWEATPENPVLVLGVKIDTTILGEVVMAMDEPMPPLGQTPCAMTVNSLSDQLRCAVIRLLECLNSPLDSRVLGRQIVREIVYRVLCEEQDGAIRALAYKSGHFVRIARVLKEVHSDPTNPLTIGSMSRRAGMSVAAFHNHFKLITGSSPLQYVKRIRLDRAKRLMIHDGCNASTAARAVGYESASQFSREYKRQFGVTPTESVERLREFGKGNLTRR